MERIRHTEVFPGLLFEPEFGSVQVKSRLIAPGIGALIGLERKRRPSSRAGLRTFGAICAGVCCCAPWLNDIAGVGSLCRGPAVGSHRCQRDFALRSATFLPRQAAGRGPGLIWVMS